MQSDEGNTRSNADDKSRTLWHVGPGPAPRDTEPAPPTTTPDPQRIGATPLSTPGALPLQAGDRVPGTRYRIVRFIGDGGMGAVYEAQHLDLERRVALKILLPELSRSPSAAQLFRREARTASKVGSDHIVEIYDFGELPDGRLMFTMDLLAGPTLAKEIRRTPIGPGRAIGILRQVCKGLAAAHAAGVVHRDVKPENIVLEHVRGRADTVKILDFGISAIVSDDKSMTPLDAGTPHILAPELISALQFDHRVDVYAVGCTAYHMLTGNPPFTATGPGAVDRILDQHLTANPTPPSQARPDLDIPAGLDQVVLRCLAKAPADRFEDVARLEAALCEAQIEAGLHTTWDDLPLPDVEPELRERLLMAMPDPNAELRPRQQRRWLWPVLTAVALVLGVGVTYAVVGLDAAETSGTDPIIETLVGEARAAAAKTHFVYPPSDAPDAPTAYSKIRELESLDVPLKVEAGREARALRQELAATLVNLGNEYWEREGGKSFAVDYYAQALVFDREHPVAAARASLTPDALAELERKAEERAFTPEEIAAVEPAMVLAEPDAQRRRKRIAAVRRKRKSKGANDQAIDRLLAEADANAAATAKTTGPPDATGASEPVQPAAEQPPDDKALAAKDVAASGRRLLDAGKSSDAKLFFERALTYDPNNATALAGMYDLAAAAGRHAEALTWAQRLVAAAPGGAEHHRRLGDARFALGRFEAARAAYTKAQGLGSTKATAGLAKVEAEIGPPPQPDPALATDGGTAPAGDGSPPPSDPPEPAAPTDAADTPAASEDGDD